MERLGLHRMTEETENSSTKEKLHTGYLAQVIQQRTSNNLRNVDKEVSEIVLRQRTISSPDGTKLLLVSKHTAPEGCIIEIPFYSTKIEAAWEMEEFLYEKGWWYEYATILYDMRIGSFLGMNESTIAWRLAHASPEDRCYAALILFMDKK